VTPAALHRRRLSLTCRRTDICRPPPIERVWTLDGDAMRWLGVVLFAAGGGLRMWLVFLLGRRFSGLVAIHPGHTLVTSGGRGPRRAPDIGAFDP
jgi:protein-S-isoprenylcysteine O-methyltransferase Ste14